MSKWEASDIPDGPAKVAVVTGANSGLGLVTARALARARWTVLVAARSPAKAESAVETIRAAAPGSAVEPRVLDLADLDSVRAFATAASSDHPRIDVLVNNAGVMMCPRSVTTIGAELQFATNHLGHFALTGLLLGALREAGEHRGEARVVTVSSIEHRPGRIHFDDLAFERGYDPRTAYQQSKFANAVFALELDRRLRAASMPVASILAHPGYSATNLQSSGPTGLVRLVLSLSNALIAQSPDMGALPQLYAATEPGVRGGEFIGPDGIRELRGHPRRVEPVERARDPDTGRRLWELSEELTGVRYSLDG